MQRKIISFAIATALSLPIATGAWAQSVGSASFATYRDCTTTAASDVCDGTGPGQRIVTGQYGGGVGFGGLNSLNIGGGNIAWSDVTLGAFDLPEIRGYTSAPGNLRMNINVFGFQSFIYTGAVAAEFSITGALHIVDSSTNPADGALPGGAIYSQYVGIWDPSVIAGLSTPQELFNALFYQPCGEAGILGASAVSGGSLTGGEQSYSATTSECSVGSLMLTPGQEVLVVAGIQLPVNRGGFADASATFITRFGENLTPEQQTNLGNNLVSAVARGAGFAIVPEPTTWAMMIFGFFGIGCALRRSRSGQTAKVRFQATA
ncbi:MAG: PEPxxWA-CTERM sorting domain-containing protein [Parasphingorhabdus sp.]|nr:PEPxxWA-CTERM sorting domain-containing protein [Parasphingorhabdus sp.]